MHTKEKSRGLISMDIMEQLGPILNIVSTVVAGILVFVLKAALTDNKHLRNTHKEEVEKKSQAMENGMLALLRVRLIDYHEKYTAKGSIPNYAYENWEKMYKAYQGLGGNGMVVQMDEDIRELKMQK